MHVAQGLAGVLGLNPWLHLHAGSTGESVSTHIRNMRVAHDALGTQPLYSRELLLAYSTILGVLLPVSLGRGNHMLRESSGL